MANYLVEQLDEIVPADCPCGQSKRAFVNDPDRTASIHLVEVEGETKAHYHKKLTEIYLFIEGEGYLELDGDQIPVKPMTTVLIKPGCRHRAVGTFRMVNVPIPAFDPDDEWTD